MSCFKETTQFDPFLVWAHAFPATAIPTNSPEMIIFGYGCHQNFLKEIGLRFSFPKIPTEKTETTPPQFSIFTRAISVLNFKVNRWALDHKFSTESALSFNLFFNKICCSKSVTEIKIFPIAYLMKDRIHIFLNSSSCHIQINMFKRMM